MAILEGGGQFLMSDAPLYMGLAQPRMQLKIQGVGFRIQSLGCSVQVFEGTKKKFAHDLNMIGQHSHE